MMANAIRAFEVRVSREQPDLPAMIVHETAEARAFSSIKEHLEADYGMPSGTAVEVMATASGTSIMHVLTALKLASDLPGSQSSPVPTLPA
jgi:hypothetical protein